ncbi:hypothetical protein WA026_010464 [Henosepilachna vigintioctopunctata]|uniref:Vitellogenin domain-containing protein n=1 Tax=Henosepilachna vigintioctopunctata TaxID=420089 RepID=A0AAW1VDD4_9CUCU
MWRFILLFFFGYLRWTLAENNNPFRDSSICGRPTCTIVDGKFKYGPSILQTYKYSVEVKSLFNGTSQNESTLSFESNVDLQFLSPCEGIISLRNIKLTEGGVTHHHTEDFSLAVSEFSVRFSFNDGIINELCPNPEEKVWVLNIKRGLLSMLHNSMKRFDLDAEVVEEDVKGKCGTKYEVVGTEGTSLLIEKNKDLTSCTSRSRLHSVIQSVPYSFRSKIRPEDSLLKSSSKCLLSIDHNIYESVKCTESYFLRPFSNRGSGVTTTIKQNLVLETEDNSTMATEPEEVTNRVSLLFDHTPEDGLVNDNVENTKTLLLKMCQMDSKDNHIEFSDVFTSLINSLKLLTPQALTEIYGHSGTLCPTGKRNILDALPYVGSTGAFVLMKDMIVEKKVRESTINDWMFFISLTKYPDDEMMLAAADFLEKAAYDPSVVLSLSALTHTYCSQNVNCKETTGARNIIDHLENRVIYLRDNDTSIRENLDEIVVHLKALGNIGQLTSTFKDSLVRIIEDENLDIEIRIAAIECHRKTPCGDSLNYFEDLYRDADNNAELRIAAYLQIMKCPNYLLIQSVRYTLEHEEVNQVGSFVWSHLKNLLKSAVPSRVEIQGLLSDKYLVKKFSNDIRKFSHNYEGSLFFEEYNIGGNYESNLIFSTNSYIPTSTSVNLTIDLFGESINLFQVSGRMQGFENYLESLFGPKGPWSYTKLQDKIPKMRFARETGHALLKSQLQSIPNVMENKFGDPRVSISVKLFGNDLKYSTFSGYIELKEAINHLNPLHYLRQILSSREINYHKAVMFLDTSYSIPSGAGLPISLSAVGTSSLNMKLFGTLEAENFAKNRELKMKADIRPTASLDITTGLCVDAFYAKAGLKVKTNVYSSTAVQADLHVEGFKLTRLQISLPQEKSEIFNSRSELLVLKHGKEVPQFGLKEYVIKKSICSWPVIEKTLRLRTCTEYHFVNVTKMRNAPYFILAGPAEFRIFLEKLDPTTKDFILEYKWTDAGETSAISLSFDAPGSTLGKIVEANFNIDRLSRNLTLSVKTTAGTVTAHGNYKNTPEEKYLQIAVNINDFKHFDTTISLLKKPINHGFIYYPRIYLGVNNERVIEIQGSVKLLTKKSISQYDVNLKLQTKRVTSKLFGYITKTPTTIATRLRMLYKFPTSKEQGIDFICSLANKSKRNIMDIQGTAVLESSSYPQYDFSSKLNLLRGHAHTEGSLNITFNHKDDPVKRTNVALLVIDKSLDDSTRNIHTIVTFVKPTKNIDLNADFKFESKAPNTNLALIVDYGKDKQFSSTIFWYHNKKILEDVKLVVNVTVPTFHPMLASFKLHEKSPSLYITEFNGTWFSAHSVSVRGFYHDKSSYRSYDYHAKLLVRSPSFQEVLSNIHYYRDANELKVDLKFLQNNEEYVLLLKHLNSSPDESTTLAKVKYQKKIYSLLTTLYSGNHQRVAVELHIDQVRDVHFSAWAHNKESYKATGIELKWDANRDPNQKLVVSCNFTKVAPFNYMANLLASYPGRTLLGNYEFVLRRGHFNTLIRLSWDDEQSFAIIFNSDYDFDTKMYLLTQSEIVTPFENWSQTFFDAGFEHKLNMYSLNGSLKWKNDQHVSVDFFGNYTANDNFLECEFRSILSSTLKNIHSLSASIAHNQNDNKMDSVLRLQYAPEEIIDIKSKWEITADEKAKNYTGTVVTSTPFDGFNKGYLISKVMITKDRYLRGVADLDFDFKKFSLSVEGRFKKLTNSMLTVNVTTPIEKYSTITGRFGFIENQRYVVAMVEYPAKIVGVEALLSIQSLTEFDVKFIMGTPLEVLQRALLIAKLKPENADFRVGWNSLVGGFTGKWHYLNTLDFEYSYILYTPLENFEENSVILKVIMKDYGLDSEVSVKLSGQKLGVKVLGESKPALLEQLDIDLEEIYGRKTMRFHSNDNEKEESLEDNLLNWSGLVEIDSLVYPTMKGTLDIEQKGPIYTFKSKLSLPDGLAVMNDRLEYYDAFCVKNKLQINTPYVSYSVIKSNFEMDIAPGQNYIFSVNLQYQNGSELVNNEITAKYLMVNGTNSDKTHNVTVHLETPIATFLKFDGGGFLTIRKKEAERNYITNLFLVTRKIDLATNGKLQINPSQTNADLFLRAKTSSIYVPPLYLKYKREKRGLQNYIDAHLDIPEIFKNKKEIFVQTAWSFTTFRDFNTYLNIQTPFQGFEKSVLGVQIISTHDIHKGNIVVNINPLEAVINNTFKNDVFHSVSQLSIGGKSFPVILKCNVIKSTPLSRQLDGIVMIRNKQMNITGYVDVINQLPIGAHVELIPQENNEKIVLDYKILGEDSNYNFVASVKNSKKFLNLNINANMKNVADWEAKAKLETSHEVYKVFTLDAEYRKLASKRSLKIEAETPIKGIENTNMAASFENTAEGNQITADFDTSYRRGKIDLKWLWLYLENMKVDFHSELNGDNKTSISKVKAFYINPNKEFKFLQVGGNVNTDNEWRAGSNITLAMPSTQNVTIGANLDLPPPITETHTVKGKLFYTSPIDKLEYLAKYTTLVTKKNYASNGSAEILSVGENNRIKGNLAIEWAPNKGLDNIFEYAELDDGSDLVYKLSTPKYRNKKAIVFEGAYRHSDPYHNVTCQIFKPEDVSIGYGDIHFSELANMNGLLNITIPYENMNFAGVNFSTETSASVYNRYLEAFWPDNSAKIDAKCDIETGETLLHRTRRGTVVVEVPIASRHRANIDYVYKEAPLRSVGNATVFYNGNNVLKAKYDCLSEERAGFEKDTTHVELQNVLLPIGADYIHGYQYGAPSAASKDTKNVKVYHLTNRTKFAVEANLEVDSTSTGQQIGLQIIHSNKTVNLESGYSILDQEYQQHSRLELNPLVFIEYKISLLNETVDQDFDAQRLRLDVLYPLRNFTAEGSYKVGEESISTDVALEWDTDNKSVEAGFDWKKVSEKHEQVLLTFKHPSFEKDVTFLSEYEYDANKIIDAQMKFDYAEDPEHMFVMGGRLDDNTVDDKYNYTYKIFATHNVSNLNLKGNGVFYWSPDFYYTKHEEEYKRSYLPLQNSEILMNLNLIENVIELKRDSPGQLSHLKAFFQSVYPVYWGNLSTIHEFNEANGNYRLDLSDKIFQLIYNMTSDGRQSMYMYGDIPDARSAKFNAWRNYDDIRISDVTYYLSMNHSRLIVSSLLWRPNLLQGLQTSFHEGLHGAYNYVVENINNTRHYVISEIKDTITGIWIETEPRVRTYLEHMRAVRIIESDIEELKIFLNNSYHANDFYIKTIVTATMFTFDELALKKHFESVPAIISEIWGIMGDSGRKIQKSIEWVIEKIRTYYKNITEFTRQLLDGDPIQHLSDLFSNILEQYEDFTRRLHVLFIQYIEKLWQQTADLVVDNWYKMILAVKPTFMKLVAYTESIAWTTSREFLDFLYIRKAEILESPYFAKFTNFTSDVDKFYKDITGNNTLSSVVKYTKISWSFFREKYMDKLPFAKELEAIAKEIIDELNELRKLPALSYVERRLTAMYNRWMWFYEYFEVESRIQKFLALLHKKVTDYSQTALQAENRYREAKTKFIFDPNEGQMLWEQKMPISWHAFNQTPNFHEIPEIKALYDIQNFFVASHSNFWNFYYDYKPYTDPSEWLPPFKAQGLIVGKNHYVTFDRKYYEFSGECSYLLSADMKDHHFTLVVSYGPNIDTHELLLIINKTVIAINIFTDVVRVGDSVHSKLPVEIGDTFIHRDFDIVTVDSAAGFILECNTKFHICTFEVSGWYFGKTAGLFGTINNEASDDFLSSDKKKYNETNIKDFAGSWALNRECAKNMRAISTADKRKSSVEVAQFCEDLFANKVSQFVSCFERILKEPFMKMCLTSSNLDEACSSAVAYATMCSYENTPLRIPDSCIKCLMPNGSSIYEGKFARFTEQNISKSADVVFLVESKECNANMSKTRYMEILVNSLDQELISSDIKDNRYAVVLFGGDGVFSEPRVRSINGEIFINSSTVMKTLEDIPIGNGSSDIFTALIYASRLNFRPAVSKSFILLACSECHESSMKYDYPILHQLLSENSISLHILMNEDFRLHKTRENKIPFGIDNKRAYTKKDFRVLRGDETLRSYIKLPKTTMGLCMPLALETNGTLFASRYVREGKEDSAKKFISVFTKRVASSSKPVECMDCECTAPSSGVSYMECYSCKYPTKASLDIGYDEDELLMSLQPGESMF